jgi:trigger factor
MESSKIISIGLTNRPIFATLHEKYYKPSMKNTIKNLPKSQAEIVVEVSPVEIAPHLQKTATKLSGKLSIPGFRQGKAPFDIVLKQVGEMGLLQEALDDIIAATYHQALQELKVVIIGQPEITIEKMAPGNDLVYKAIVTLLPKVTIGDYKKISLKRDKITIADEDVEKVIADIRRLRSSESLVDRVAQKGDRVEVDFDVFVDKVPIEGGAQKHYPLTIGEGRFIPGFEDELIGIKAGENRTFSLSFSDQYHQKSLAGKQAEFQVKCNGVFEVVLPEFSDEFAQSVSSGQVKTAVELRETIKTNLEQEAQDKQEQRLEVEMLDKIIDVSTFDELPDTLVDNEIHKMMHELEDSVSAQGFKFDQYLLNIKKTKNELEKEMRPQAEKRIKSAIIAREIYQEQKITVTPDELKVETEELLSRYPENEQARKQITSQMYQENLHNIVGNRKVMEYLKNIIIT